MTLSLLLRLICRFLADMLISFFAMAVHNVLLEPVSQADFDVADHKVLRSYIRPPRAFDDHRWTTAHTLGQCLRGTDLSQHVEATGGSDWKAHTELEGFLPGVRGAGEMTLALNATDAEVIGVAAWTAYPVDVKLSCIDGTRYSLRIEIAVSLPCKCYV